MTKIRLALLRAKIWLPKIWLAKIWLDQQPAEIWFDHQGRDRTRFMADRNRRRQTLALLFWV
jgi:hypothetical protein